jgi:metal-responsive CopG/Arc/MetJ family transcriptional regulator
MHAIENSPFQHGMPVQVRLQKNLFDALEGWRRKQETIPSRPEAIRRLLWGSLVENRSKREITKRPTESKTA